MKQNLSEIKRMQQLAGILTENQEENLDEGFKEWLIGLGLAASTILGGVKVYQMDQEQLADRAQKVAYYEKNLTPVLDKMDKHEVISLGSQISQAHKDFVIAPNSKMSNDQYEYAMRGYLQDYMKSHPQEFSIGVDGLLYWNEAQENPYK